MAVGAAVSYSVAEQVVIDSHTLSAVAEGAFNSKEPAAQLVHGVQLAVLGRVLKVPLKQTVQERSAVVLPSLATENPATHMVLAIHAVAGFQS